MSDFHARQSSLDRALLDPAQHVHYAQGMVLGTDDFNQEFAYLSGRDQWLARDAVGYGTACGLRVSPARNASLWELVVGPGAAVTPAGRLVRVPREQCADLAAWVAARPAALAGVTASGSGATTVRLRLTLRYRECLTDPVPIAGDACRTEDDSLQPSRVTDDFLLELTVEPPVEPAPTPREEEAVRALVAWLRARVTIVAATPSGTSLGAFLDELRQAARSPDFPPRADPPVPTTTPEASDAAASPAPGAYPLSPADAERFLREALRVWVVELRPRWHRDRFPQRHGPRSADERPVDEGVLLAVVRAPLTRTGDGPWTLHPDATLAVASGDENLAFVVDESTRPWLLHLRLLQELVLHHARYLPPPADTVVAETAWGQPSTAGAATPYSRADHTHGTPTPAGDVTADEGGALRVGALQHHAVRDAQPEPDDVLRWAEAFAEGEAAHFEWVPTPRGELAIDGDVTGTLGSTRVERIQRRRVADEDPDMGDLLAWRSAPEGGAGDDGEWAPFDPGDLPIGSAEGGDVQGTLDDPRVERIQGVPIERPAGPIADGHVLTFRGIAWRPEAPAAPASLLGDVVTDAGGAGPRTRLAAIQGTPVAAGNPGAAPRAGDVLTHDGAQWVPRAPAPPGSPDPEAVRRPDGVEEYRIVAAGTLPIFDEERLAVGTPGLRVTLRRRLADSNHLLLEFTYEDHARWFAESFDGARLADSRSVRRAPSHGFIVKTTLFTPSKAWPNEAPSDALLDRGLAALLRLHADVVGDAARAWSSLGAVTVSCELVTRVGIVLRLTFGTFPDEGTLSDAALGVEVSWCPKFEPQPLR